MAHERHSLLSPVVLEGLVRGWLAEDTPGFDYGGYVVGEVSHTPAHTAVLLCKSPGVLAGVPFFNAVFKELGCSVEWMHEEGVSLPGKAEVVARVTGRVRYILLGERVALNCLARVSGVATGARRLAGLAEKAGWRGEVAGTRKTTPGFRIPEKYGLLVGGISTHRMDLSSMIMLKDNHIWTAGSISQAVKDARRVGGFSIKIEVECRSLSEATEAAEAGADIVMLDNFDAETAEETAQALKSKFAKLTIEASGGITEESIVSYMTPNIDVLSTSRTTQGYGVVDFSLKVLKDGIDPSNRLVTKS